MGRTDVTGVRNTCNSINAVQAAIKSAFKDAQRGISYLDSEKIDASILRDLFGDIVNSLEGKDYNEMEDIRTDNSQLRTFGTDTEDRRVKLEEENDRLQQRVSELESEIVVLKEQISELEFGGQTEEA
jgi:predicted RNase H-like nuclease (RuvC/YqgF family)